MSLLSQLGLKPTLGVAQFLASGTAYKAKPPAPPGTGAASGASSPSSPDVKNAVGQGGDDAGARAAALALKREIAHRHKEAHEVLQKLEKAAPQVDALVAAAKGPQKAALEAKQKLLARKIADTHKEADELQADLEALESPATTREQYVAILARGKSKATVVGLSEIDRHADDLSKKALDKHDTHITTSYQNGRATVEKTENKRTVGLDGVAVSKSRETETTVDGNTVRTGEEKQTQVSLTGKFSQERKKSVEIETADGKKMKVEKSSSIEVSAEGASGSRTEKAEHRDGSSNESAVSGGVERGEGKVVGALGKTSTVTDASGDAVTKSGKGKAGLVAGDDGYGGTAEGEGSYKNQRKGGFNTGLVGGLKANIVCNIGEPIGKAPKPVKYPLTLQVDLGVSVGVSSGHDKKDGIGKVGVEAKAGKSVFMKRTYMLSEDDARAYVASLEAANGGVVAGTKKEFQIIAAGAKKGWPFAQSIFLGTASSGDLKSGESSERGGSTTKSGKVSGDLKVVSLEASVESSEQHAAKTTRNEDGTLGAELSGSSTDKVSGKVGIKSGVVGGSAGRSHSFTTSSGYVIKIDPKKDKSGERQKALDACAGQADYDAFAAKYPDTVESATRGTEETDEHTVSVSVGAVDAEIGLHKGLKKKTRTGKDGKLEMRDIVGSSGGGGSVGIGKTRIGDSEEDEAHAQLDSQGNAKLELTKTVKSTDWKKLAKSKLPFLGGDEPQGEEAKKGKGGLLAKAAGGGEVDTDRLDRFGLTLTNKDLDAIGKIATGNVRRWEKAAMMDYNQSHADWEKARAAIASGGGDRQVVADELATFIGGSESKRLAMVQRFLRPDGDVSIGKRTAFPESLKDIRADYERLVLEDSEEQIEFVAAKEGPAKAGAFGKETFDALEKIARALTAAKGALAPAVRAEMLSAVNARKGKVLAAMQRNAGKQSEQEEKAAREAEYRRMTKACLEYQFAQDDLFANIKEWWAPGRTAKNVELIGALQQLRDLYAVWKPDYARCADLGKKIGYPEANYDRYAPAYAKFDDWEKKIHQY